MPSFFGNRPIVVRNSSGFTLVELLISLVVFLLLSLLTTTSLGLIGDIARRVDLNYANQTRNLSLLQDSLKSTFYYVGQKKSYITNQQEFFDYFYGSPHEIVFVSACGVARGGLVLSRVYLSGSSLFLDETSLYDPSYAYLSPDFKERVNKPLLLLNGVKELNVQYFVHGNWQNKIVEEVPDSVKFVLTYDDSTLTVQTTFGSRFRSKKKRVQWLNDPY